MSSSTVTEIKPEEHQEAIDTLAAIFPQLPRSTLQRFFVASSRDLERATTALLGRDDNVKPVSAAGRLVTTWDSTGLRAVKRKRIEKLDHWLKPASSSTMRLPARSRGEASTRPTSPKREVETTLTSTVDAYQLLQRKPTSKTPKLSANSTTTIPLGGLANTTTGAGTTPTHLPPLTLSTPEAIAKHTRGRIILIPNVLPKELASMLFQSMLDENDGRAQEGSKEPWGRNKWYMFDREVESPHTTSFYLEKAPSVGDEDLVNATNVALSTHWYNGTKRQGRYFTPLMDQARSLIQPLVNLILGSRRRHPLEYTAGEWVPNVAAANCYRGAKESVGPHSDVLTYLGPFPTIASLSLGCTRPFRLRPFMPLPGIEMRSLDLVLPHNSLCLMLPGTQEFYKHSIQPVSALDTFRIPGQEERYRERINITFRHYRPDYAPLPVQTSVPLTGGAYAGTPHCQCKLPTILRPDGKGRARAYLQKDKPKVDSDVAEGQEGDDMIFFWTCSASQVVPGQNCGFWKLLSEQQEGRGPWFRGKSAKPSRLADLGD
ncbi:hypothetical protein MVLG_03558 [Microbotryum lychnidis-dioicae p1A1 Lamole]|uniref:Fe2OG dioxygenase domain-containing protein n=1 Tax=Microbotryum lychnidis-dioicae (strain p1A1 Lamole / MvSl-1064) TaxID=683840 RepID=U5H8K1_USTV1|nr:hypothetical protein MVLG_03558 [Microbotryum lychnidis-dioicae p1A1 Lamole]|eukprot:KDE06143.1 hypothetical protein MVLG_03558 [Microbotryum lychnidis-dioicae p1A1 Lamole]